MMEIAPQDQNFIPGGWHRTDHFSGGVLPGATADMTSGNVADSFYRHHSHMETSPTSAHAHGGYFNSRSPMHSLRSSGNDHNLGCLYFHELYSNGARIYFVGQIMFLLIILDQSNKTYVDERRWID